MADWQISEAAEKKMKKPNPMAPVALTFSKLVAGAFGMVLGKKKGTPTNRRWPVTYELYTKLVECGAGCLQPIENNVDWFNMEFVVVDGEPVEWNVEDELDGGVMH